MLARRASLSLLMVIVVAAAAQTGCGRRFHSRSSLSVTSTASASLSCPPEQIVATPAGRGQFQVQGCGRTATLFCAGGRRGRMGRGGSCEVIAPTQGYAQMSPQFAYPPAPMYGQPQPPAYAAAPPIGAPPPSYGQGVAPPQGYGSPQIFFVPGPRRPAWSQAIGVVLFEQVQGSVLACVPGNGPLVLHLDIDTDGRIRRALGIEALTPIEQHCVATILREASVPGGLQDTVRVPFTFR